MRDINAYIIRYLNRNGNLPEYLATDDFNFLVTGYIDSLALFDFVVHLEKEFKIEFSDKEISSPEFTTIGGLTRMIREKSGGGNGG